MAFKNITKYCCIWGNKEKIPRVFQIFPQYQSGIFRMSNDSQAPRSVNYRAWNQLIIGPFGHENGMS